ALLERLDRALERTGARAVVCAGGVACNGALRAGLASLCAARGVRLLLARPGWCTDNAAMIAGWAGTQDPATWPTPWTLELEPHPPLARATP
ncbi:MAG: tRNA (adenosine(37)-N6)-threonylcarbamoyltransferase complex transferase subunit TsaD, partial [Candidatus Marinimicrobia bacterium]|nr:tRNA (adenosine(37)-N6)-threonylcarbamoyltransferase complex transferase subunit TsaD [Candidatus Neomarinimicrobiota bacterium]